MKMKSLKRILSSALAVVLTISCMSNVTAAEMKEPTMEAKANREVSASLTREELGDLRAENLSKSFKKVKFLKEDVDHFEADQKVRAIIVLEGEPAANPKARAAVQRVEAQHAAVKAKMADIDFELKHEFTTLVNGMSADVAYGDLEKIAAMDGVENVYLANYYEIPELLPPTDGSSEQTGVIDMWNSGYKGEGKVVAVLDTGLSVNHEAFKVNTELLGDVALTEDEVAAKVQGHGTYISEKVPFAYDYGDMDNDVNDIDGHGTHVSGIATGCTVNEEGAVTFTGAAPAAQLLSMKIFMDSYRGTSSDIYLDALEDAYLLGADVINMSIGSQNGFTYDDDLEYLLDDVFTKLEEAGVMVCISAGNEFSQAFYSNCNGGKGVVTADYADYGTVGSPSTYMDNASVAAVESLRYPAYVISANGENFKYTDGNNTWRYVFAGQSLEYVMIPGLAEVKDFEGLDVNGKIAVMKRGELSFQEKVDNAAAAGAVGAIVYDNVEQGLNSQMLLTPDSIPAVFVTAASGRILAEAESKVLTVPEELKIFEDLVFGGTMSIFSSWGTTPDLTMKPTITSVGGNVYSSVPGAEDSYDVYSGTSMAAPNLSGSYAVLLEALEEKGVTDKVERMELAQDLMESGARIIRDENGSVYSPRRQGSGLGDISHALDIYENGAYLEEPLFELGDDAKMTGTYRMTMTLRNDGDADVTYNTGAVVMRDQIMTGADDVKYNTLQPQVMDAKVEFDCGDAVTVPAGSTEEVNVTITLSEDDKEQMKNDFENGGYVEGYVTFTEKETQDQIHGTFLGFFGDWTQAPVLEQYDFRDMVNAHNELISTGPEGSEDTWYDLGYTYHNSLNINTDVNMTYLANYGEPIGVAGDNIFDNVQYHNEHIAFSTYKSDADRVYGNGLYIMPMQLRNLDQMTMTVKNKETGEIYKEETDTYIPKAAYDPDYSVWRAYADYEWDGRDKDWNIVPSGTVATVSFDAVASNGKTWEDTWSFDVMVDYVAPKITDVTFDPETKILSVTATDENYLQAIYLADYYGYLCMSQSFSSDEKNGTFTSYFDTSILDTVTVYVMAMDYATNQTMYPEEVVIKETDVPCTVTYHTPYGEVQVPVATGQEYMIEDFGESYDNLRFQCWTDEPYEKESDLKNLDNLRKTYYQGEVIQITGNKDLYAMYAVCDVIDYDPVGYAAILDAPANRTWEGEYALCGLGVDWPYFSVKMEWPYAMTRDMESTYLPDLEDYWMDENYNQIFCTDNEDVLWVSEMVEDDVYTLRHKATGKYLTGNAETMELSMTDTAEEGSKWNIEFDSTNLSCMNITMASAPTAQIFFIHTEECGREVGFQLMDNTVEIPVSYGGTVAEPMNTLPGYYYWTWLYAYTPTEYVPLYYTSYIVDRDQLSELVAEAEALDPSDYVDQLWNEVNQALKDAQAVLDNPDAASKEIQQAYTALKIAMDNLKEEPADTGELEAVVKEAKSLDENSYSKKTWKKFQQDIAKAVEVLEDKNASQKDVDKAAEKLQRAMDKLEKKNA